MRIVGVCKFFSGLAFVYIVWMIVLAAKMLPLISDAVCVNNATIKSCLIEVSVVLWAAGSAPFAVLICHVIVCSTWYVDQRTEEPSVSLSECHGYKQVLLPSCLPRENRVVHVI